MQSPEVEIAIITKKNTYCTTLMAETGITQMVHHKIIQIICNLFPFPITLFKYVHCTALIPGTDTLSWSVCRYGGNLGPHVSRLCVFCVACRPDLQSTEPVAPSTAFQTAQFSPTPGERVSPKAGGGGVGHKWTHTIWGVQSPVRHKWIWPLER